MLGPRFLCVRILVATAVVSLGLSSISQQSVGQSPVPSNAGYRYAVTPGSGSPSISSAADYRAGGEPLLSSVELASHAGTMGGVCGCTDGPACTSCTHGYTGPRGCDRWYLALSGGWQQRELVQEAADASTFIDFDSGFALNGAVGYRFNKFRLEAEYSFMNNECSEAGSGGLASGTVGNINLRSFMFNAYRDFDIDGWLWKPYIGGGIGTFQSEINGLFPEFFQTVGGDFAITPINATSNMPFAYQFRAGASRPLGDRTSFFTAYRYFHGNEMEFSSAPFASGAAPTFNPNGARTHGVEFGLRISF